MADDVDEITEALGKVAEYAQKPDRIGRDDWDDAVFQAARAQAHAAYILVKLTKRLEKLTWTLLVLTAILAVMTAALIFKQAP